jgi:hypothetical protein
LSHVRRVDRTRDKVLRGELPPAITYTRTVGIGDGAPCAGCTETIQPTDTLYLVRLLDLRQLKFHEPCFKVWQIF